MTPSPDTASPTARLLGASGALLLLLGLLTGGYIAAAMSGQIQVDVHATVAAHLNALFGGLILLGLGWTLPMLRYGAQGQQRLAWLMIVPNYANWLLTAIKAALQVSGVSPGGSAANTGMFVALNLAVVLPSLVGGAAWVYGFGRPRA